MDGQPIVSQLTRTILCAHSVSEMEQAFAALVVADRLAADAFAIVLVCANPSTAPLWQSILDHAEGKYRLQDTQLEEINQAFAWLTRREANRESGPSLAECDAVDTARDIAGQMGWHDMERGQ